MSKSKKFLFIMMFFMVITACLMPNIESADGSGGYREVTASSTTAVQIEDNYLAYPIGVIDGEFLGLNKEEESVVIDDRTEGEILVDDILASMTMEEKVDQIFFIKNESIFGSEILYDYPVGGIILFSSDFEGESPESLREKLGAFQDASKIPLLIGVDEEGGDVVRLSYYSALADYKFLSPRALYNQGGYDAVLEDATYKSRLLLSYGINVNFAPVCDVSLETSDYMYNRSFGISAEATAEYIDVVVNAMEAENMGGVLKHFPGYGNNGDTHTDVVRDTRSYEEFVNNDLLPFEAGIAAGADCVLVSHNIVECMDSEWPASLSYKVISILRNDMGFEGVIITDDLMMNGVSDYVSEEESAVRAIIAGNDMILSTHFQLQYQSVIDAMNEGTISEERIDESVRRILLWKYELGLLQ